jgi:hypothetical protein
MKKVILLISVCLLFALKGYSQFAFGVAPGIRMNTAYFGIKLGKVVPYVGFQLVNAGVTYNATGSEWTGTALEEFDHELKISGNLYVPDIGVKFFLIQKNKLNAYINLNIAKPLIRAKYQVDGEDVEAFTYGGEAGPINDVLKHVNMWGGELGFGVEYFFDDNFSVGGEYGIAYIRGSYKDEWEEDVWNGSAYQSEDFTSKVAVHIMPTYSKVSLNFYFGGGKGE